VTSYEDIIEEVVGYKNIKEITYTAQQQIFITVNANNSECYLSNRTVNLEVSDQCTEIKYTGDQRVFTTTIEQNCNDFLIQSDLKRKIANEHSQHLYIN